MTTITDAGTDPVLTPRESYELTIREAASVLATALESGADRGTCWARFAIAEEHAEDTFRASEKGTS
jgi:hypothetical protein